MLVYGLRIIGVKDKHVLDEAVEKACNASIWDEVKDVCMIRPLPLVDNNNVFVLLVS